jgi:type II secretory pathway pseudopilin PulG
VKHYKVKQYTRQAGMTLIELTVVLLVLIGLAGLLIPYVSGFVSKTHDGTGTFNSAGLDNNIQRYIAEKTSLPNN